jgi:hypothetical protein
MPKNIAIVGGSVMQFRSTSSMFAELIGAKNRLGLDVNVAWGIGCVMSTSWSMWQSDQKLNKRRTLNSMN